VRSNTRAIAFPRQVAMYIVKAVDHGIASGNWPAVRREASHHGAAFDQQDRGVAPFGQGSEPHDYND